jgi:hypothetical protein
MMVYEYARVYRDRGACIDLQKQSMQFIIPNPPKRDVRVVDTMDDG